MSSMFKGMLSSLSRSDSSKSATIIDRKVTTISNCHSDKNDHQQQLQTNGNHREPAYEANGFSCGAKEETPKRSLSKRGKKKLSAMISRLNSSINHSSSNKSKSVSIEQNNNDSNSNNLAELEDTDEDEEFCEPLCQDGFDELEEQLQEMATTTTTTTTTTKTNKLVKMDSIASSNHSKSIDDFALEDKDGPLPEEDCDIPTFLYTKDCDKELIEKTRVLLRERYNKNPDNFYPDDYQRMLHDDWTVTRFLLRRRQDPKRTAKLMEECGCFRKQYKMSEVKLPDFPIEFHKPGGLFKYAPDRAGNLTVYMRVKMYRRVPEISDVFKAFILCVIEEADVEAKGRGVAVVFDLSGAGLQNVDLSFLSWLLSSFRNYCPKGVSYIMVYNLPWILSTTCRVAMTWLSATNRRALRFVHGDEIQNFIAKENLPDYCGGTCKIDYCNVPEGAKKATEVCGQLDITREQALKIRELFKEYLSDSDDDIEESSKVKKSKKNKNKKHNSSKLATVVASLNVTSKHDDTTIDCDTPKDSQELSTANGQDHHLNSSAGFVSQASKFIA